MSKLPTSITTTPSPKKSTTTTLGTCTIEWAKKAEWQGALLLLLNGQVQNKLQKLLNQLTGPDAQLTQQRLHAELTLLVSQIVISNLLLIGSNSKIRLSQLAILIREFHRTSSFSSLLSSSSRLQLK
jgi:hypothetical protein